MMVCDSDVLLGHHADPTAYSSYPGENEVDTPVSMHSYRSWCGTTSLFASGSGIKPFVPESCLLHWIQSSQENQSRVEKAFKCPQCSADYEIESDNPLLLRILNKLNGILTRTGKIATLAGIGTTVFTLATCMFSSFSWHASSA